MLGWVFFGGAKFDEPGNDDSNGDNDGTSANVRDSDDATRRLGKRYNNDVIQ